MRKPKLGTGKRFAALKKKLAKKGARTPGALAAWIGRKKLGKKRFQKLSVAGKKRKSSKKGKKSSKVSRLKLLEKRWEKLSGPQARKKEKMLERLIVKLTGKKYE